MGNSQGKPIVYTDEVNLNHFRLLRVVGKGAFGKVRIVERKDSGLTFALKYIRKDEVVRSESVRNIIRERRMLEHLSHPFLCNLRYSFQDVEYLYLVVDLMEGGDLRFHISRKTFTEECIRFWMAELACALRYIHGQGIVHRDVKPDNILLDAEGHVHLADFNVASDFSPDKPLTSRSGTLSYLAPEIFQGQGYLSEVDWWSLGVTFYECIYGRRPFDGKTHSELVERIVRAKIDYLITRPPVSIPCVKAISALLERNRSKRMGAMSWDSFVTEPFFDELNFARLEAKQISPIFVPASDKTNFDATYDLEELLLEEAPLEARAKNQKPRAELRHGATSREKREDDLHKMIDKMFEPFNYTAACYERKASLVLAEDTAAAHALVKVDSHPVIRHASPAGSPPISPASPHVDAAEHFPPLADLTNTLLGAQETQKSRAQTLALQGRPKTGRQSSRGGGISMVLNESGSWSALADQGTTLPGDTRPSNERRNSGSILGFLKGQKSGSRSGRPKEAGVLGKVGIRQVIS
ncbi:Serine/threonine kinase [Elasticomyces elasticus]|nr:Serine/threonine kinase [Elasticomyces elasticus]